MKQTQAVIFQGPSSVGFGPVDMPDPGPGEVQVQPGASANSSPALFIITVRHSMTPMASR